MPNFLFNLWHKQKPPDHDIGPLREQAIKTATEEGLTPNLQGASFLQLARAELWLSAKDNAPTVAELEKHLNDLTDTLAKTTPVLVPVFGWGQIASLRRLWAALGQYRCKRTRERKIRHVEDLIAAARRAQVRKEEWVAEKMAVLIGVYQLQLGRTQAAIKVAARTVPAPVPGLPAAAGDKKPEERKQTHGIRIAATS